MRWSVTLDELTSLLVDSPSTPGTVGYERDFEKTRREIKDNTDVYFSTVTLKVEN